MTETRKGSVVPGQLPRLHLLVGDERLEQGVSGLDGILSLAKERLAVHLRARRMSGRALYAVAREVVQLADRWGTPVFVNDRADVAWAVGASGIHLREDSLPPSPTLRRSRVRWIGRSVHRPDHQLGQEVDYVVLGSVYDTPTHPGGSPIGIEALARASQALSVEEALSVTDAPAAIQTPPVIQAPPVIAVGGISPSRVQEVMGAGAYGVMVHSGVWAAPDPLEAVLSYLEGPLEERP